MIAGASFDLDGQSYVGQPIRLAVTEVTKSPNAVFAFPRETKKTFDGSSSSVEGVSVGAVPPVQLNYNYSTGVVLDISPLVGTSS